MLSASFLIASAELAAETPEFLSKTTTLLTQEAVSRGNLKFISKVIQAFHRQVSKGEDATADTFKNAIALEKKKR